MISIYLMGGLGNQLFQLFTLFALSAEYQRAVILPFAEVLTTGITRPTYWKTFLSKYFSYTTADKSNQITNEEIMNYAVFREPEFCYNKITLPNRDADVILYGYFQSYKYFDRYKSILFDSIGLADQQKMMVERFSHILTGNHVISMHFRLGDYKEKQGHHPVLPLQYYRNALSHLVSIRANESNLTVL
jgi:hypothetical protein